MTAAAASRAFESATAEQAPKRHAPFVAVQRVLAEIGSAAARGHAHGQAALRIVEDEPVLAAVLDRQLLDFPLGELHDFPALRPGPQRVRGPLADPAGRRHLSDRGGSSQRV